MIIVVSALYLLLPPRLKLFYNLDAAHLAEKDPSGTWGNMTCPQCGSQLEGIILDPDDPQMLDEPWRFAYYCRQEDIFWVADMPGWYFAGWYGPFDAYWKTRNTAATSFLIISGIALVLVAIKDQRVNEEASALNINEKMKPLASFKKLAIIGLGLSILGLLLPWGKEHYLPVHGVGQGYMLGIELLLGTQVIVGCIIAAIFSFFYVTRGKKYWLVPVLLGGLFAMCSTLAWMLNPGAEALHWSWVEGYGFTLVSTHFSYIEEIVDFGAYVSLIGSFITSSNAIIWLRWKHSLYA